MLTGTEGVLSGGPSKVLYAGGPPCTFERDQVVRFGKSSMYGDFVTRYWVKLADGREVFVNASAQSKDDERWLRREMRKVPSPVSSRHVPDAWCWVDVTPGV